ncbi:hypothetical protein [Rubritalea tangerina]|uniref:Uncharacterized protein n=1 Tax=Rubritalea tangerina TaxID=430798 RepID=A0ABW4ZFL6_9BACT
MKVQALSLLSLSLACHLAPANEDIINFKNNDTLHGTFLGFKDNHTIQWESPESDNPIDFKTDALRKIIFQKGLPRKPFTHTSSITLANGDILPCSIVSIDSEAVAIHADYLGELTIPRNQIRSCDLNPLGQQILYQGPFQADEWRVVTPPDTNDAAIEEQADSTVSNWEFANFSWYNRGQQGSLILNDVKLPSSYRVLFKLESARATNVSLIFGADFKKPVLDDKEGNSRRSSADRITSQFGSCFALRLSSGSTSLSMYNVSDDGESSYTYLKPVNGRSSYRSQSNSLSSIIELRVDTHKQSIASFRNGQLMHIWSLKDMAPIPNGSAIGFNSLSGGDMYLTRISDFTIAPWNGVMESPLSLESNEHDVVMINNGTDRFSGSIIQLDAEQLTLDGNYTKLNIPRQDLQSLNFNLNTLNDSTPNPKNSAQFHMGTSGKITATPTNTNSDSIHLSHPILGELKLNFNYLTAITYDAQSSLLDQWNTKLK